MSVSGGMPDARGAQCGDRCAGARRSRGRCPRGAGRPVASSQRRPPGGRLVGGKGSARGARAVRSCSWALPSWQCGSRSRRPGRLGPPEVDLWWSDGQWCCPVAGSPAGWREDRRSRGAGVSVRDLVDAISMQREPPRVYSRRRRWITKAVGRRVRRPPAIASHAERSGRRRSGHSDRGSGGVSPRSGRSASRSGDGTSPPVRRCRALWPCRCRRGARRRRPPRR